MFFFYERNVQVSSDTDSLHNALSPRSKETGAVMNVALQFHNFVSGISQDFWITRVMEVIGKLQNNSAPMRLI